MSDVPTIPPWLQEYCDRLAASDPVLTNLCLNVRRLDVGMTLKLSTALQQNSALMILNLTSSFANDFAAFSVLAEQGLMDHQSLQVLHFSYNRLENVSELKHVLTSDTTLQSLHLDHNVINSSSGTALAQGLHQNKTLKALYLGSNCISDEGCLALADALCHNTSLQRLDLSSNRITITGARALLEALESHNFTLQWLNLDQNADLSMGIQASINVICRANRIGRQALMNGRTPPCMWPRLLRGNDSELVWYLLRSKPDLVSFTAKAANRKRNRDSSLAKEKLPDILTENAVL